jgi:hypothetical protein
MQFYNLIFLNYFLINYFVIKNHAFPLRLFHPNDRDQDIIIYKDLKNNSLLINKITEGEIGVVTEDIKINKQDNFQNKITGNKYIHNKIYFNFK